MPTKRARRKTIATRRWANPEKRYIRALDVAKTNQIQFLGPWNESYRMTDSLPTVEIDPLDKSNKAAIVSWRWDGDPEDPVHFSRNLCAAVAYAKLTNVQYLLIDVISIDQHGSSEQLMERLKEFAEFYKALLVIGAYQKVGKSTVESLYRPWIFSELQDIVCKSDRFVHVKHNVCWVHPRDHGHLAISDFVVAKAYGLWAVVPLLFQGITSMRCIDDLQYIVPQELSGLVRKAFVELAGRSRADYLLTVVLLTMIWIPEELRIMTRDYLTRVLPNQRLKAISIHRDEEGRIAQVRLWRIPNTSHTNGPNECEVLDIREGDRTRWIGQIALFLSYDGPLPTPSKSPSMNPSRKGDLIEIDINVYTGKLRYPTLEIALINRRLTGALKRALRRFLMRARRRLATEPPCSPNNIACHAMLGPGRS